MHNLHNAIEEVKVSKCRSFAFAHAKSSFLKAEGPVLEKHTVPTLGRKPDIIYNSCKYIEVFHCHPRKMVSNLWSAISLYSVQ